MLDKYLLQNYNLTIKNNSLDKLKNFQPSTRVLSRIKNSKKTIYNIRANLASTHLLFTPRST